MHPTGMISFVVDFFIRKSKLRRTLLINKENYAIPPTWAEFHL